MDAKTLEALKASIAKWERNAKAETPMDYLTATTDCPLCDLFYRGPIECKGCPVSARTRKMFCAGSPYAQACSARRKWWDGDGTAEQAHAAARKEVAFLKSLLPKGEQ